MRYQSQQASSGELIAVTAKFLTGATVTVEVFNLVSGASVPLTAGTAAEINTTGFFVWLSSDITTQPEDYTQYLVVFTDDTGQKFAQKIVVGGYVDANIPGETFARLFPFIA